MPKGVITISKATWTMQLRQLVLPLAKHYHVEFEPALISSYKDGEPERRLMLQEKGEYLVFQPIFSYKGFETKPGDKDEIISLKKLRSEINDPFILRYAGHINEESCKGVINYYPEHVHPGHMGILPSAIGFDPIIRLQSGGLKVGELLLKNEDIYNGTKLVDIV